MKLPNVEYAFVPHEKITGYLLSEERSGGKTDFFIRFGFSTTQWRQLELALLTHAATHEAKQVIRNQHGTKYVIEGALQTPDGRNPHVRTVWIIEHQQERARLVTAYPLEG
jgi:hypothetical protein